MAKQAAGWSGTRRRTRRARIPAAAALGAAVALAAPAAAQASEGGFLNPGFLLSFMAGPSPAIGYGVELSYMHYWDKVTENNGFGGFAQAQSYGDHGRYALGVQAGGIVGLELGAALREASASRGATYGIHAGVYGSVGFVTLGLRGTVPVVSVEEAGKPGHGGEIGLVLGLKIPIEIGEPHVISLPHGRPLRVAGEVITAPAAPRQDWAAGMEPLVAGLDEGTRRALARAWLADAASEHASVAAFARLSLDLLAAGAPPDLVAQAHAAALEEVGHARQCFALASAYAGAPLGPGPLAMPAGKRGGEGAAALLRALAVESFEEGCLGEGTAAACARQARAYARDAAARATLGQIAREEARHAALGWAVVAWCVEAGGADVVGALEEALAEVEARGAGGGGEREGSGEAALAGVLAAHGRLAPAETRRVRAMVERRAARRLRGMLGTLSPRRQLAS